MRIEILNPQVFDAVTQGQVTARGVDLSKVRVIELDDQNRESMNILEQARIVRVIREKRTGFVPYGKAGKRKARRGE